MRKALALPIRRRLPARPARSRRGAPGGAGQAGVANGMHGSAGRCPAARERNVRRKEDPCSIDRVWNAGYHVAKWCQLGVWHAMTSSDGPADRTNAFIVAVNHEEQYAL